MGFEEPKAITVGDESNNNLVGDEAVVDFLTFIFLWIGPLIEDQSLYKIQCRRTKKIHNPKGFLNSSLLALFIHNPLAYQSVFIVVCKQGSLPIRGLAALCVDNQRVLNV